MTTSHFSPLIDGSIIGVYLVVTMAAGLAVRRYVTRVEDFLVAGREMNLHLGIASLATTEFGVITCMYTAQAAYNHGFGGVLPGILHCLALLFVGLTGFCVTPLREAGVMTLPELFERRFGPFVRWLAGVVIVLGGLLNMGMFLKIGGDFLCLTTGYDVANLVLMMAGLLLLVVVYTVFGGMLSVLVTDFLQFVVMSLGLLVVTGLVLWRVGWDRLVAAVQRHHGDAGFALAGGPGQGWDFLVCQLLTMVAVTITWQATLARVLSAKDAATGRKIYSRTSFFMVCRWMLPGVWGIAALATLGWQPTAHLPAADVAALTPEIRAKIDASPVGRPLEQLTAEERAALPPGAAAALGDVSLHAMPRFLGAFLPVGMLGLLVAAMLAAEMSTDSGYMLAWGSVIYNDVLAPLRRRRPWSERTGLLWNRAIVALIGVYLFVYGLWYRPAGDVWSYIVLSATIYASSMATMVIACCYWPRANRTGAIGAILLGSLVPVVFLVMEKLPATADLAARIGPNLAGIASFAASAFGMVAGSLLGPRDPWSASAESSTPREPIA